MYKRFPDMGCKCASDSVMRTPSQSANRIRVRKTQVGLPLGTQAGFSLTACTLTVVMLLRKVRSP